MKPILPNCAVSCKWFLQLFFMLGILTANGQQIVNGSVSDTNNVPLFGASVVEKQNPSNGTTTDLDGNFSITVSSQNATLVISYIGYVTKQLDVAGNDLGTITLEEGVSLDDVIVTARKTEEYLQDVPISITALGAKELARKSIIEIQDIVINTPSFTLDNFGGTKVRPAIRGLGSENTSPGQDFSTGVFLDGIYQSTNGLAAVDVYDLERVEVLKGPQGTAWGKNVIGGGINFVTAKPRFENSGQASVTAGNFGAKIFSGHVNFTTSNTVAHRIATNIQSNNGFAENFTTGNAINDLNRLSARYSLRVDATEDFRIDFSFDTTNDTSEGKNIQVFDDGNIDNDAYGYLINSFGFQNLGERREFNDADEFGRRNAYGFRLQFSADLGGSQLTSLTSYRHINDSFLDTYHQFSDAQIREAVVSTGTGLNTIAIGDNTEASQVSTELKLSSNKSDKFKWDVGVFLSREQQQQTFRIPFNIYAPVLNADSTAVVDASNTFLEIEYNPENTSNDFGVFAKADWNFAKSIGISAGVRYNANSKDFTSDRIINRALLFEATGDDSWNAITWRGSINWTPGNNSLIYASAARGFSPGGFGPIQNSQAAVETALDLQTSTAYEIGAKLDFANNKGRFNIAAFTTDFEGLQAIVIQGDEAITDNIESSTIKGIEVELSGAITRHLFGEVRYAYLDTNVDGFLGEDDLRLLRVPEHDVVFNLRYEKSLGNGNGFVEIGSTYSYRTEVFDSPLNIPTEERPSFGLFDSYLSWSSQNNIWNVKLWGKNIADTAYSLNSFGSQGVHAAVLGNPRTIGVTLTRFFN